ncbi:hypothetical protein PCH_Pc16g01130 [Penicillium rubens Wisconsin 54-1255]|uniref:Uncharacterized protein n=1 Tax=Penicillium rubens (strain ATCC 28089 / DSM 1075 / NRRL 1951 / Wisconsin 54-1255) TaxID=500485 RepID=B6H708_PENRW|nr:hypothetical protein PCH_Pc16g01130 [Penicillium rubens Wisconsin 54-1255]
MTVPGFLGGFWGIGGIGEVKGKKANNKFGFKEDQEVLYLDHLDRTINRFFSTGYASGFLVGIFEDGYYKLPTYVTGIIYGIIGVSREPGPEPMHQGLSTLVFERESDPF